MEKKLQARLKETPTCAVSINADFSKDWLLASYFVEQSKKELLNRLKNDLHEKIATLSFDDIEFKII